MAKNKKSNLLDIKNDVEFNDLYNERVNDKDQEVSQRIGQKYTWKVK